MINQSIKLIGGDKMINLNYVFHPWCCAYFCLKRIIGKEKVRKINYMSLYEVKEELIKFDFYCMCFRVNSIDDIKCECITLVKNKNSLHYVIVTNVKENHVYIYNPLFLFVKKVRKSKFIKKWSKICLFYKKI